VTRQDKTQFCTTRHVATRDTDPFHPSIATPKTWARHDHLYFFGGNKPRQKYLFLSLSTFKERSRYRPNGICRHNRFRKTKARQHRYFTLHPSRSHGSSNTTAQRTRTTLGHTIGSSACVPSRKNQNNGSSCFITTQPSFSNELVFL
jgi:hypothetical protein